MSATDTIRTPDRFAPVLTRLGPVAAAYYGVHSTRLVPVQFQERAFSYLCRVRADDAATSRPLGHVYVKAFKPKVIDGDADAIRRRVVHEFDTTQRVHASLRPYRDLGTVPPVACYPEHLAIVTAQVDGPTLLAYLETHARWFPGAASLERAAERMRTVGRWIRVFQSTGEATGPITVASLREYIDVRLRRLVRYASARFGERDRAAVLRCVDTLGAAIDERELAGVPIHADLSLGNVLVAGERIVVLDFAMARDGTTLHDLTRVSLHVDLLGTKPQLRRDVLGVLQQALLAGFDARLTPDRPLFRLMMMLHRVNHFGTLSLTSAPLHARLYHRLVRDSHRRWMDHELARVEARP